MTNVNNSINIKLGDTFNNKEISKIFQCGNQGGIRPSNETNSIIVILNYVKSIYKDLCYGEERHIVASGTTGDQEIKRVNKSLFDALNIGNKTVYLFESFEFQKYTFAGKLIKAGEPYTRKDNDINGKLRKVWVFPTKIKFSDTDYITEELLLKRNEVNEQIVKNISDKDLINYINNKKQDLKNKKSISYRVILKKVDRCPYVKEYAHRRAKGFCQLCKNPAPFKTNALKPFLEVHHIIWLSKGGSDTIDNTVCLCPNCHRKMHIINHKEDKSLLMLKAKGKLD